MFQPWLRIQLKTLKILNVCIFNLKLDFKEENKNLNYRLEMLALDVINNSNRK